MHTRRELVECLVYPLEVQQNKTLITSYRESRSSDRFGRAIDVKPLGTITMYFPFVDLETSSILQSIMDEAYNYADFIDRLIDKVCSEDSSEPLAYIAIRHANNALDDLAIIRVVGKYSDSLLLSVHRIIFREERDAISWEDFRDQVITDAKQVLATNPEDWIAFTLYNRIFNLLLEFYSFSPDQIKAQDDALDHMDALIQTNETLRCFEPLLLMSRGLVSKTRDRDTRSAMDYHQSALEIAIEFDDRSTIVAALSWIATSIRNSDTKKALELLQRARGIVEDLGVSRRMNGIIHNTSTVYATRGEHNAVIDCQLEVINEYEREENVSEGIQTYPPSIHAILLARAYNQIGMGEEALEWCKYALESSQSVIQAWGHLRTAWSFINLGRLDEAEDWLNKGHKMVIKLGPELLLEDVYHLTGLLEMTKGDIEIAMLSFERALEIADRIIRQSRINPNLLKLTECELALWDVEEGVIEAETSGPWMTRLDETVRDMDLPGVFGESLLLKAELRLKQGLHDEAMEYIREARTLAQQPSMSFLEDKIESLMSLVKQMG